MQLKFCAILDVRISPQKMIANVVFCEYEAFCNAGSLRTRMTPKSLGAGRHCKGHRLWGSKMLEKNKLIYKTVHEAIERFGERHNLYARGHFAHICGYNGPNGHVQMSSMLNTTSYCPAAPKRMSVDQLMAILDELDAEDREFLLGEIAGQYGLNVCRQPSAKSETYSVERVLFATLGIDGVHGELAGTLADAVADGEIAAGEKERIRKAAAAVRKAVRELEEMMR